MCDERTAPGKGEGMTFEEWARKLEVIYRHTGKDGRTDDMMVQWNQMWDAMAKEFPHTILTVMDPQCGCCWRDDPSMLNFDTAKAAAWYEILYPTYKPTHTYLFEA